MGMGALGDIDFSMDGAEFGNFDLPLGDFQVNSGGEFDYGAFITDDPGVDLMTGDLNFDSSLLPDFGAEIPGLAGDEGGGGNGP